jgi:hypothetical protein
MRVARVTALALVTVALPLTARAELLAIPFIGSAFQGQATLPALGIISPAPVDLSKSLVIGGAGMWLTSGVLGAEAELTHSPRFFERATALGVPDTVISSSATTFSGNLVVAMPRSVTRDSLRPYVVGGLGLMGISIDGTIPSINKVDRNVLALNIGGGVIGYLGDRSGVRFDLRRSRVVRDGETPGMRLSYWRASVGVIFRY